MQISPLKEIANELPFFKTVGDREKLLGVGRNWHRIPFHEYFFAQRRLPL